jgi:glutathione S-transferase
MPTVLGISASPFVRKVRVALAEKGIAYDHDPVIPVNVSDEYRKISPLGKIPAYKDGNLALCDSSIICAYIERKQPQPALYPGGAYEYARALWFEEYADTALAQTIGPKIFFQKVINPGFFKRPTDEEMVKKAVGEELPPLLDYLEGQLEDDYFVGKAFSIADIGVAVQLVNFQHAGFKIDAAKWPKLAKWYDRVCGRPSIKALIDEESAAFAALAA